MIFDSRFIGFIKHAYGLSKTTARRIFTGEELLEDHVLVVTENGSIIDLVAGSEAGDDVEALSGLLCPGFINAHCHTELSHMKGRIPRESGMVPFLSQVMFERHASQEEKLDAIRQALDDMYRNGIVAIGDICNTDDSISIKASTSSLQFHHFIETSGFVPASANARMEQALLLSRKFSDYFLSESVSITPHAAYSVSARLFNLISDQQPGTISIHNQESQAEEDFIRHKAGSMLQLFERIGVNVDFFEAAHQSSLSYTLLLLPAATKVILVHNCFTTKEDISLLNKNQHQRAMTFFLCLCPNANLYIGNPLPLVHTLKESGLPICVGTDSLASNDQLSILAELQTLQLHFPLIALEDLLSWATMNGAKALGIESNYGSFEKGKKPGVLLIRHLQGDRLQDAFVDKIY